MGSVNGEIARIEQAKKDIETAIEFCGVNVPDTALIDDYDTYIRAIPSAVSSGFTSDEVGGPNQYIESIKQVNGAIVATPGGIVSSKSGLVPGIPSSVSELETLDNYLVLGKDDENNIGWHKFPISKFLQLNPAKSYDDNPWYNTIQRPLKLTHTSGIEFVGHNNTKVSVIKFLNNTDEHNTPDNFLGHGVKIGCGGVTIIGGGDSSEGIPTALGINSVTGMYGQDRMIVANDTDIEFYSNCQGVKDSSGLTNQAKKMLFSKEGILSVNNTPVSLYGHDHSQYCTMDQAGEIVRAAINELIGAAPEALNTLEELAKALGEDENFATTVASTYASKAITPSLVPIGTSIPAEADLNTLNYIKVGMYYCSTTDATETLKNCPTSDAFMMEVSSPLSATINNETTSPWVYRLRKITRYNDGTQYVQRVNSSSTAGEFTYSDWYLVPQSSITKTEDTYALGKGSNTKGIYIDTNGKIQQMSYSVNSNVPSGAKFTDTDTITAAYCSTAAATADKEASFTNFKLKTNSYVTLFMLSTNTAKSTLRLNINNTGFKNIYINGVVSSATNNTLNSGTYIVFYDGTNYYFRTDSIAPMHVEKAQHLTPIANLNDVTTYPTVSSVKNALVNTWNTVGLGVGSNVQIPAHAVDKWNDPSHTISASSQYSMIKIGGCYTGTGYGQWLLSSYSNTDIGYVGRNTSSGTSDWTDIYWILSSKHLKSGFTKSTLSSNTPTTTANRQYAVVLDSNKHLSVNVPWTSLSAATSTALGGIKIGYTESAANLAVKLDNEKAYVTLTSAAISAALGFTPGTGSGGGNGSVTSITPGIGLTGANGDSAITSSGTINLKQAAADELGGIKIGYTESGANLAVQLASEKAFITLTRDAIVAALGFTPGTSGGGADPLTQATANELGGIKIGYSENGKNYPVQLDANYKAFVNVPWTTPDLSTYITKSGGTFEGSVYFKSGINLFMKKDNPGIYFSGSGIYWHDASNSAVGQLMTFSANTLYIGQTAYAVNLEILKGKVSAFNGFYQTSDANLKIFKEDIKVDFNKLKSIPKKYFYWKSDEMGKLQIGTSAQEVQKLYPELVSSDNEGVLSVAYDKLSILALKSIDELYEMILDLKSENEELRNKINALNNQ